MALSVAACICRKPVVIDQPEAVQKSAPEFFDEFRSLGGKVN
jgi:3-phosphoshikimate 1-carboxyvinyltransferase